MLLTNMLDVQTVRHVENGIVLAREVWLFSLDFKNNRFLGVYKTKVFYYILHRKKRKQGKIFYI